MKEKIFGMLAGICILLLACSEREDNDSLINNSIMGKDKVTVNLSLSSIPEIQIDGNTDYRPASRAAGDIRSIIANNYQCLVMKEIGSKWYVDTLTMRKLTGSGPVMPYDRTEINVKENTSFNALQLTLRPGHYRVLVVLNSRFLNWNSKLVPGAVVKGEADTIAHAYTYYYIDKVRFVRYEIFAGTAEFTIEKTSDLHSASINGDTEIAFSRKVMQMRYLLKDHLSEPGGYNFSDTPHRVYATLKATGDTPFCDGLDCWGNAYYNQANPTLELQMCTDLAAPWQKAETGGQYKIISNQVTRYSPFIFADETKEVLYKLDDIRIAGQSGTDGYIYEYRHPIPNLIVTNNTIQPIVFQTTNETDKESSSPQTLVILEYLEEESSKETFANYFGPYFECNTPKP